MTDSVSPGVLPLPGKARLRWSCRRGMKELDVLLEPFVEHVYDTLDDAERRAFCALVELEDPVLYVYLVGREVPADPAQAAMAVRIRENAFPR